MSFFSSAWIKGASSSLVVLRGGKSAPTECNIYYFKPADADRLDFGTAFTGNFKANIATFNGNVGVNAQITTTLINSPEEARDDASLLVWNQIDLGVTAMGGVCDNTFDGVVANYAKDDIWFDVNMGPLISPPPIVETGDYVWSTTYTWNK